jgi:cell division protein FtsB
LNELAELFGHEISRGNEIQSQFEQQTKQILFDHDLEIEGLRKSNEATKKRVTTLISDFDMRIAAIKKTENNID